MTNTYKMHAMDVQSIFMCANVCLQPENVIERPFVWKNSNN